MSQHQQQFEEMGRGYQPQNSYSPYHNEEPAFGNQLDELAGLKADSLARDHASPSVGQRLALAIVSISMLAPLIVILAIVSNSSSDSRFLHLTTLLIALGLICASILGINILFYRSGRGIASPGQRLALAIVSISMLVPVLLTILAGTLGLPILVMLCITILALNLFFYRMQH